MPAEAGAGARERDFGAYVHVPFCRVRCGYCDFNTYTATELRGVSQASYHEEVALEIAFARRVLDGVGAARELRTVFFGGGTPTLLPAAHLVAMLAALRQTFGLAAGAEVTVEANPDSVTPGSLAELAAGGVTRVSFGVQSAVPHVLRTLDRTHDPANVPAAVAAAKAAGLEVSVDLIYGAPGESMDDWRTSLDTAIALEPHHVSAYSLIIEEGTQLARRIRRGELPDVEADMQADMYEAADAALGDAGYEWYEVSNWSRGGAHPSRHNLSYWRDADWWGFGPGAHSHVGGVRWWNAKHPAAYAQRLHAGETPGVGREVLDEGTKRFERVMLGVRLREGLDAQVLVDRTPVAGLIADGLVDARAALGGRIVPTLRGRLLGDAVARRLT
ncbi:coproporphyrinogen III oxidase [Pseudoclavibacter endophyticus]|nr:coproporphyrinogen III oxidase [Pseudoclavibacter endophyticus]